MDNSKGMKRGQWSMMIESSYDRMPSWWYDPKEKEKRFEDWYAVNKGDGE